MASKNMLLRNVLYVFFVLLSLQESNSLHLLERNIGFYDAKGKNVVNAFCFHEKKEAVQWWNRSNIVTDSTERITTSTTVMSLFSLSTLRIVNVTKDDADGVWSCVSMNTSKKIEFTIHENKLPGKILNLHISQYLDGNITLAWRYKSPVKTFTINIKELEGKYVNMHNVVLYNNMGEYNFSVGNLTTHKNHSIQVRAVDKINRLGPWSNSIIIPPFTDQKPSITISVASNHSSFLLMGLLKVTAGKNKTLTCISRPLATIRWFKDNHAVRREDRRFSLSPGEIGLSQLTILNADHGQLKSDGVYYCEAKNKHGKTASKVIQVSVLWLETKFVLRPRNRTFYLHNFLRLSCLPPRGNIPTNVQWKKDGKPIVNIPNYHSVHYMSASRRMTYALDIAKTDNNTAGQYSCVVYGHAIGHETISMYYREANFSLAVAEAPLPVRNIKVAHSYQDTVVLQWKRPITRETLKAIGIFHRYDIAVYRVFMMSSMNPTPQIVSNVTYNKYRYFEKTEQIIISSLKKHWNYTFFVIAEDKNGEKSVRSSLVYATTGKEESPPYIMMGPKPYYRVLRENQKKFTLSCNVLANPTATITWLRNNVTITSNQNFVAMSNGSLILLNITYSIHDGVYSCNATNKLGIGTSASYKIRVLYYRKSFIYGQRKAIFYDVDGFRSVRILCIPPDSFPAWKVSFLNYTDRKQRMNPTVQVDSNYMMNGTKYYSLLIPRATRYEVGNVGCIARMPLSYIIYRRFVRPFSYRTKIMLNGPPPKHQPRDISIQKINSSDVHIYWNATRDDVIKYGIVVEQVSVDNTLIAYVYDDVVNSTSITLTGLKKNGTYILRIQCIDRADQNGEFSFTKFSWNNITSDHDGRKKSDNKVKTSKHVSSKSLTIIIVIIAVVICAVIVVLVVTLGYRRWKKKSVESDTEILVEQDADDADFI